MAGGGVCVISGLLHAYRNNAAAFSRQTVKRPKRLTVSGSDQPNAALVASGDRKAVLAKGCTESGRGVGLLPRLPDSIAHVRKGHALAFRPRPLAAAHSRLRRLGQGLSPKAGGNVGTALKIEFGGDGSRAATDRQVVTEIDFKAASGGFESYERTAVVQRLTVRPNVADDQVIVLINSKATAVLAGVLPNDVRMIFRAKSI